MKYDRDNVLRLAIREAQERKQIMVVLQRKDNQWVFFPYENLLKDYVREARKIMRNAVEGTVRYVLPHGEVTKLS